MQLSDKAIDRILFGGYKHPNVRREQQIIDREDQLLGKLTGMREFTPEQAAAIREYGQETGKPIERLGRHFKVAFTRHTVPFQQLVAHRF